VFLNRRNHYPATKALPPPMSNRSSNADPLRLCISV
jgi:hypothetical protein